MGLEPPPALAEKLKSRIRSKYAVAGTSVDPKIENGKLKPNPGPGKMDEALLSAFCEGAAEVLHEWILSGEVFTTLAGTSAAGPVTGTANGKVI
jgi:hypothetical protein